MQCILCGKAASSKMAASVRFQWRKPVIDRDCADSRHGAKTHRMSSHLPVSDFPLNLAPIGLSIYFPEYHTCGSIRLK